MAYTSELRCVSGDKYRLFRGYINAYTSSETDTTETITYEYKVQMKDAAQYGVYIYVYVNGTQKAYKTGYITSASSSWKNVITGSGTVTINKTSSSQKIPVKITVGGTTVSGYGPAYGSGSATVNVTVDAKVTVAPIVSTYTIYFNPNGGDGGPTKQTKTQGETLLLSSLAPYREGYTFLGWDSNQNSTTYSYRAGGAYTTNAGTTLYAIWRKRPEVPKILNDNNVVNIYLQKNASQKVTDMYFKI